MQYMHHMLELVTTIPHISFIIAILLGIVIDNRLFLQPGIWPTMEMCLDSNQAAMANIPSIFIQVSRNLRSSFNEWIITK